MTAAVATLSAAATLSAVAVLSAGVGAGWGALLPALVHRYAVAWPDGEPRPDWRRCCDGCDTPLGPFWLARWRCPRCGKRLGPRWWVTVPLAAGSCGLVGAALGPRPDLPAFVVLAALGILLALVDTAVLRLPDPLVRATFAAGLGLFLIAALVTASGAATSGGALQPLLRAGLGALVCGSAYLLLALVPGSQLGYGDVKLGSVLGLYLGWLGWYPVVAGLVLTPLVNLPAVLALVVVRRAGRKTPVPYGPAMIVAALAVIVMWGARRTVLG